RMELLKWKMLSRCSEYDDRQQTRLILSPQTWNKARRILVTDGVEISGRQTKLLQLSDLAKSEIGIVGPIGDLGDRHELHQRGHRRREGRVRGVVVKPPQFAFDPFRREFLQVRPRTVKRIYPPGHHRNRAAGVGKH